MTPQEQAAAVLAACGANRGNPVRARLTALIGATAIRAAVDLVLPETPVHSAFLPEDWHLEARAQFLAIADAMEAPTDAS